MLAFLGFAGLVIDIGGGYAEQRQQRAIADGAALAGVQELQRENSRSVGSAEWTLARTRAMQNLANQLTPSLGLPGCAGGAPYGSDIINCAMGDYYVSVLSPAPSCNPGACAANRSIQVTVREPRFGLIFAKLFNQVTWNVAATSVAELDYSASYNMVTLRPPKPSRANRPSCAPNCDDNEDNIFIDGSGTKLTLTGDLGTNTNVELAAGQIVMSADRHLYHFDAYVNWAPRPPMPRQLSAPIEDPNYPIPSRAVVPPSATYATIASARMSDTDCATLRGSVPSSYGILAAWSNTEVLCFKPGIYDFQLGVGSEFSDNKAILLSPGVYFFNEGLNVGSGDILAGGFVQGTDGVAVVFPSGTGCTPGCAFTAEGAKLVALNAGSAHPTLDAGTPATAARHFDGTKVEAPGDPPVLMTIIVEKDTRCVVGLTEPPDCPTNQQLKLPGGGSLYLTGIQYAATDNVTVRGGSGTDGYVGQLIAWTAHYTGGSQITLTHAGDEKPGIYRLAVPCSPSAACSAGYVNDPVP